MFKKIILLFLIHLSPLVALDLNQSHSYIGKTMLVYEDPDSTLNYEDISKLPLTDFKPLHTDVFSTPFTQSAYWFYFELNNSQSSALDRLIVFEAPWLDYIQVNILHEDSTLTSHELGNIFEYSNRSLDHHLINLRHTFKPGNSKVFIQVKTRDPFVFTASIMQEKVFLFHDSKSSFYLGLLYGVLFALLFYNLFLFLGTKKSYYLYYVLFVFSFIVAHASYNNYTFKLLFANTPLLQTWAQSSGIFFFSLGALLFTRSFLNLKHLHPKLNTMTIYFIIFFISTLLLSILIGGYRLHIILIIAYSTLVSSFILIIAFISWRNGNQSARFFLLGTISGLIGTIITAFSVMGLISYTTFTYHALDIGMIVDAILLSLALADRLRLAYKEKHIAVKASKTDVLTGLLNRRAYYEIGAHEASLYQRYKHNKSLIFLDIDKFKEFNDTYGHDIGDQVLQHFAKLLKNLKREEDYAFRLGGDEFLLLLPQADIRESQQLALRIKEELMNNKIYINTHWLTITVSIGIAQFQEDDNFIRSVEKRADLALYSAKTSV